MYEPPYQQRMTPALDPNLRLRPTEDDILSDWTNEQGDLHFFDYGFDDYNTEIIALNASYEHRNDIKALDWEDTHRKWTGDVWQLDFEALDIAVKHFLEHGYNVTIAASDLTIFLSDYDAPFLKEHIPVGQPPGPARGADTPDDQPDLNDF